MDTNEKYDSDKVLHSEALYPNSLSFRSINPEAFSCEKPIGRHQLDAFSRTSFTRIAETRQVELDQSVSLSLISECLNG